MLSQIRKLSKLVLSLSSFLIFSKRPFLVHDLVHNEHCWLAAHTCTTTWTQQVEPKATLISWFSNSFQLLDIWSYKAEIEGWLKWSKAPPLFQGSLLPFLSLSEPGPLKAVEHPVLFIYGSQMAWATCFIPPSSIQGHLAFLPSAISLSHLAFQSLVLWLYALRLVLVLFPAPPLPPAIALGPTL